VIEKLHLTFATVHHKQPLAPGKQAHARPEGPPSQDRHARVFHSPGSSGESRGEWVFGFGPEGNSSTTRVHPLAFLLFRVSGIESIEAGSIPGSVGSLQVRKQIEGES
jgi:hypothetical protein